MNLDDPITCLGITASTKQRCTRTKLQDNGYCFQHQNQALVAPEEAIDMEMEPLLSLSSIESDSDMHEDDPSAAHVMQMPTPMLMEPIESSSSNNDNNVPPSPLVRMDSPDSHIELNDSKLLHQCEAIANSTGVRCHKLVSYADQTRCPAHGGAQKSPVQPQLAQCQAIASKTRRQCMRQVSVEGETHCPAHGGRSKKAISPSMSAATTIAPFQSKSSCSTVMVPWPALMMKCFDLWREHGEVPCHQCNLDDAPCAPLAVVLWIQQLAKLCAQHHTVQPTSTILRLWLADTSINHGKHDRFELLLTASRVFGASNMRWLLLQLDDDDLTGDEPQP